ncbi:NACHT domain-containing protein [Actinomadura terrae]|uniref:NACHT domain-containing protein n=1 Tax=Actinomadura terrae TaxID=604353 RepID=UPI001FA7E36F|nr:NACHT domain-containing protein [Actinomadura terrae]
MADKHRPHWPLTLATTAIAILILGTDAGLTYVLWRHGPAAATIFATLAAVPLAAAALFPAIAGGWRSRGDQLNVCTPEQLDRAQQLLARLVLQQWRQEIIIRQLDDPAPLAVRWRLTELPVMDHPGLLTQPRSLRSLLALGQPRFSGRTDRIADIAAQFRNLTRRRLVILGDPGMGKTTLAVLLLRHLLQHPQPGEPVPIMFALSGWDPDAQPFHDWLTDRLSDAYPVLRAHTLGPNAPQDLVTDRRILAILDGLDELPEALRPKVITALNSTLTTADAIILTCRTNEYEAAVRARKGDALTAGAVIEPSPLQPADAAAYLTHLLPPRPSGTWPVLLGALAQGTTTPLAQVLTTPLALWLLRKVYIDAHTDPAPLLTPHRFLTPEQITDHLLDHLTQALVNANPPHQRTNGGEDQRPHPFRPRYAWKPNDVQRWLSFLARHLHTTNTTDVAWWQLHQTLSSHTIRLTAALTVGLTVGLIGGLTVGLTGGLVGGLAGGLAVGLAGGLAGGFTVGLSGRLTGSISVGLAGGLAAGLGGGFASGLTVGFASGPVGEPKGGLTAGLAFGLVFGLAVGFQGWLHSSGPTGPSAEPSYADLRLRGRTRSLIRKLAFGLVFGLASGLASGPTFWFGGELAGALTVGMAGGLATGLAGGLVFGLPTGLAFGLTEWAKNPQASETAQNPPDSLRRDIQITSLESLAVGLAFGLGGGLAIGLAGELAGGLADGLTGGLAVGLVVGLGGGLTGAFTSASGTYLITLVHLSVRHRAPRHLMRFLEDAHRLGLLRQTGAVYQFRHAKLQERLANTHTRT